LPATNLTAGAVRSYRTFSPLPSFPCRILAAPTSEGGRYIFCATFLQVALTGRYPAHCPAEFGLSSPPSPTLAFVRARADYRRGDRLACCDFVIIA